MNEQWKSKETMAEAEMVHVGYHDGFHYLQHKDGGPIELWFSRKNHASYGIIYKNTHLEFARSATAMDLKLAGIAQGE